MSEDYYDDGPEPYEYRSRTMTFNSPAMIHRISEILLQNPDVECVVEDYEIGYRTELKALYEHLVESFGDEPDNEFATDWMVDFTFKNAADYAIYRLIWE